MLSNALATLLLPLLYYFFHFQECAVLQLHQYTFKLLIFPQILLPPATDSYCYKQENICLFRLQQYIFIQEIIYSFSKSVNLFIYRKIFISSNIIFRCLFTNRFHLMTTVAFPISVKALFQARGVCENTWLGPFI